MQGKKPKLISGWKVWFIRKRLRFFIFSSLLNKIKSPTKTLKEVNRLRRFRNSVHGKSNIKKFIKSEGRYYWASNFSGFPSEKLKQTLISEFKRNEEGNNIKNKKDIPQQTIFWAITNRCPLSCQHCFEWDNIDNKDHLSFEQLETILHKIENHGITHIQLSGGEPIARFNDLIPLIKQASARIDFWLFTSGFGMTKEKALKLKNAGLVGVNISLDHWNKNNHNTFRNNSKSFSWVMHAVENCRNAGLIICLSLCATKEFTNSENLNNYLKLAKKIGVHFIQILEPRAVGNFSNKDVKLSKIQIDLLSEFTIKTNNQKEFKAFPTIMFYGYHQRKLGCMAAGNRYFYIDSMGEVHACPFCQGSVGNALDNPLNILVQKLQEKKCHVFKMHDTIKTNTSPQKETIFFKAQEDYQQSR